MDGRRHGGGQARRNAGQAPSATYHWSLASTRRRSQRGQAQRGTRSVDGSSHRHEAYIYMHSACNGCNDCNRVWRTFPLECTPRERWKEPEGTLLDTICSLTVGTGAGPPFFTLRSGSTRGETTRDDAAPPCAPTIVVVPRLLDGCDVYTTCHCPFALAGNLEWSCVHNLMEWMVERVLAMSGVFESAPGRDRWRWRARGSNWIAHRYPLHLLHRYAAFFTSSCLFLLLTSLRSSSPSWRVHRSIAACARICNNCSNFNFCRSSLKKFRFLRTSSMQMSAWYCRLKMQCRAHLSVESTLFIAAVGIIVSVCYRLCRLRMHQETFSLRSFFFKNICMYIFLKIE